MEARESNPRFGQIHMPLLGRTPEERGGGSAEGEADREGEDRLLEAGEGPRGRAATSAVVVAEESTV